MKATRYLAKLYEMPTAHGTITAFDSYASHLYVGTDNGTLLHFNVEGLPEYSDASKRPSAPVSSSPPAADHSVPLTAASEEEEESIFTSLLSRIVVSDQHGPIQQLQHSRTQPLLFVLCDNRLAVWRTTVAATGTDLTFLCEIGNHVGTFFVSSLPATFPSSTPSLAHCHDGGETRRGRHDPLHASTGGSSGTSTSSQVPTAALSGRALGSHQRTTSMFSGTSGVTAPHPDGGYPYPTSRMASAAAVGNANGDMPFSAALAAAGQMICTSQHNGRSLYVYEFNALLHGGGVEGGSTVPPRAVRTKEFLLPEPAQCLVMVNPNTVCVGLRQEYTLLSLTTGASRSILRLGTGRSTAPPLLCLGEDGEVHMRYHKSVFSAALKGVGQPEREHRKTASGDAASSALGSGTPPPPRPFSPAPSPRGAGADTNTARTQGASSPGANFSTFRILGRTAHMEEEVELIASRYPFLFAFTREYCDVFTAYEDEPVERLPLAGCRYAAQLARGETLFVASSSTVWMARLFPLRTQLADLVAMRKTDEAFELLASQRARTGRPLEALELELHLMAGFTQLHHCRPDKAMRHFMRRVDPRDVLLHLPECIPPARHTYSAALRALLAKGKSNGGGVHVQLQTKEEATQSDTTGEAAEVSHGLDDEEGDGYWSAWPGRCPYNTCTTREALLRTWLETYESFPFVPTDAALAPGAERLSDSLSAASASSLMLRQVPGLGPASASYFLEHCWASFKDAVMTHFASELLFPRKRAPAHPTEPQEDKDTGTPERQEEAVERATTEEPSAVETTGTRSPSCVSTAARKAMPLPPAAVSPLSELQQTQNRAMAFSLLVLSLERQDRRLVYRLVSTEEGLRVQDCYDLLCHLREYRLLAILLFRCGFVAESLKLIRLRLNPVGSRDGGAALAAIPATVRAKVEAALLDGGARSGADADAEDSVRKLTYLLSPRQVRMSAVAVVSTDVAVHAPPVSLPLMTAGDGLRSFYDIQTLEAPGDFSEVFYLVETMDLPALAVALRERPALAFARTSDGRTPLHLAVSMLTLLHMGAAEGVTDGTSSSAKMGKQSCHNALWTRRPARGTVETALLECVLSCITMLVDAGCPTHPKTFASRESCLDVAARVCGGAYLDLIIATLLATVEVNVVCRAAATEASPQVKLR